MPSGRLLRLPLIAMARSSRRRLLLPRLLPRLPLLLPVLLSLLLPLLRHLGLVPQRRPLALPHLQRLSARR